MNYIIFDLEWNNAYNYKLKKGMNEVIEIGAVKLDEQLNIIDTFKQLLKPRLSKKLSGHFKELTRITMEEIKEFGIDFDDAFSDFSRWSRGENNIYLSWSNSDLYVLCDNFKKFDGYCTIPFMKRYADAQKYCMSFLPEDERINQISLLNYAEKLNIDVDVDGLHRALEDCYLTARCLKAVFDKEKFNSFVCDCSNSFFERLMFKPYFINLPKTTDFNLFEQNYICQYCKQDLKIVKQFECTNNTFKTVGVCKKCNKKYWVNVRAKKTYDDIVISKRIILMNKKRANKVEKSIISANKK